MPGRPEDETGVPVQRSHKIQAEIDLLAREKSCFRRHIGTRAKALDLGDCGQRPAARKNGQFYLGRNAGVLLPIQIPPGLALPDATPLVEEEGHGCPFALLTKGDDPLLLASPGTATRKPSAPPAVPAVGAAAGEEAALRFVDYFTAKIPNDNTLLRLHM
jgi:hypothetical protein